MAGGGRAEAGMAKRWYSVSVLSNFEKKIAEQIRQAAADAGLEDEIDEVLVPTEEVSEIRRGKKVATALADLEFSRKRIAETVKKTLESAIANAENNHDLDVDALVVAEASVGKSITMKRFHTRGRGKSTRILKPFSRLRIVVREQEEA